MLRSFLYSCLCLAGLISGQGGLAQVQQVVGAAGGTSKALTGYTIDFTVGETVILTAGTNPSGTEGFQQPLTRRDLPDSNLGTAGWYIKVYPNPIHDQLGIHAYMDRPGNLGFRLVDIQGRVLRSEQLSFQQGYNDVLLNTGSLARGVYVLYISDGVHGGSRTVKLLKE